MKIDRRKQYYCVFDTETLNGIMRDDKLDLSDSLVYDLGWQIIDKQGNIYERKSFAIYETFIGMKEEMKSAYYAEKIPQYWEEIKSGERILTGFWNVRKALFEDLEKYECFIMSAHNARFDYNALNNTIRYLTKSKYRYFFPYNIELWDTLKMARQTYGKEKCYRQFCIDNEYVTKHKTPQPKMTAEILYRYISGNYDFEEVHKGIDDVEIESQLLVAMLRKHKSFEKRLFSQPLEPRVVFELYWN